MLYSTSAVLAQLRYHDSLYFLKRQLLWAGFGLLGLWAMRCIPYSAQRRLAAPALLVTFVALLLVLVPIFGKEVGGARRWLTLGPLSIQPSEFAKLALSGETASLDAVERNFHGLAQASDRLREEQAWV